MNYPNLTRRQSLARKGGFTLPELLAVVGVILCLAAILVPMFVSVSMAGKRATAYRNMAMLNEAIERYNEAGGLMTASVPQDNPSTWGTQTDSSQIDGVKVFCNLTDSSPLSSLLGGPFIAPYQRPVLSNNPDDFRVVWRSGVVTGGSNAALTSQTVTTMSGVRNAGVEGMISTDASTQGHFVVIGPGLYSPDGSDTNEVGIASVSKDGIPCSPTPTTSSSSPSSTTTTTPTNDTNPSNSTSTTTPGPDTNPSSNPTSTSTSPSTTPSTTPSSSNPSSSSPSSSPGGNTCTAMVTYMQSPFISVVVPPGGSPGFGYGTDLVFLPSDSTDTVAGMNKGSVQETFEIWNLDPDKTMNIRNIGLSYGSIVGGAFAAGDAPSSLGGLQVTAPASYTVAPMQFTTFTVTALLNTAGSYLGYVLIDNDCMEYPIFISVSAYAVIPPTFSSTTSDPNPTSGPDDSSPDTNPTSSSPSQEPWPPPQPSVNAVTAGVVVDKHEEGQGYATTWWFFLAPDAAQWAADGCNQPTFKIPFDLAGLNLFMTNAAKTGLQQITGTVILVILISLIAPPATLVGAEVTVTAIPVVLALLPYMVSLSMFGVNCHSINLPTVNMNPISGNTDVQSRVTSSTSFRTAKCGDADPICIAIRRFNATYGENSIFHGSEIGLSNGSADYGQPGGNVNNPSTGYYTGLQQVGPGIAKLKLDTHYVQLFNGGIIYESEDIDVGSGGGGSTSGGGSGGSTSGGGSGGSGNSTSGNSTSSGGYPSPPIPPPVPDPSGGSSPFAGGTQDNGTAGMLGGYPLP